MIIIRYMWIWNNDTMIQIDDSLVFKFNFDFEFYVIDYIIHMWFLKS